MKISGLIKIVLLGVAIVASTILPNKLNAQVNTTKYSPVPITQNINVDYQTPQNWKQGRPYWDMPVDQGSQVLLKTKKTLEYQFNTFHQPNEIYGKETCHGGGDGDGDGINVGDQNAAQIGTYNFALDVTGNNIINAEDATEIGDFINNPSSVLQSHWNFLSKNEKLSWFTKMANIYTVDQKQYVNGDENTRYISGNFAAEFALRMQGYNKELTDMLGGTRKDIPSKYGDSLEINGRGNIPVYFVSLSKYDSNGNLLGVHGMNWFLDGDNPLDFNDGKFYEPQGNIFVNPGDWTGSLPFNSTINIYKFENFGGSSWGEDMPSRSIGGSQETMKILKFRIDSNGNSSLDWNNPNLLLTKPTVSIGSENNSSNPIGFYLAQNYPNPFNPTTTIQFDIPLNPLSMHSWTGKGDSKVETGYALSLQLIVYDITGKEISTLVNNINSSGTYNVEWNASGYPSGIYFYQLQSNSNVIATKKMLLLR